SNLDVFYLALERLRREREIHDAVAYVHLACWDRLALRMRDLAGWTLLYDCLDEWENFPLISAAMLDEERELVRSADLVAVVGQKLQEKWTGTARHLSLARN